MDDAKTPAVRGEKIGPPARGPETKALLDRAAGGDEGARDQLDALLDDPERGPRVLKVYGNPPGFAEAAAVLGAAGKNLVVQEALTRRMADLRAELAGPDPSPIERLLVERAVFCWFAVWRYEEHLATGATQMTWKQSEFHQRRIDAAHRRYLSSLRTLAQVRKLALPAVQVNIGGNQVNIGGNQVNVSGPA